MSQKLKVVVAGRSERELKPLAEALARAHDVSCSTHLISDGPADFLASLDPRPDVLLLRFDADHLAELEALAGSSAESRPPLIVVGPASSPDAVRLAVRSGARDFLPESARPDEVVAAVERLRADAASGNGRARHAEIIVVIGASGGVGTSTVATNLAYLFATETKAPTLLLDLDLNAAPLSSFLDISAERGLPAALAEVEYLDEQALPGYIAKHRSGLRLMSTPAPRLVSAREVDPARFATLMGILSSNFRYIVVDASHALDDLTVAVLGMARNVVLVLQQSVVQLRQAAKMVGSLCGEIGLVNDRIHVVVNRHAKHSAVGLDDIRRALGHQDLTVLPSHYKSVLASIDSGLPLAEHEPSSAVVEAIQELQREIVSGHHVEHRGLLRRALPIFSGG